MHGAWAKQCYWAQLDVIQAVLAKKQHTVIEGRNYFKGYKHKKML